MLETISKSDTNKGFELHALFLNAFAIGDEHTIIVFQVCGERDIKHFGKLKSDAYIPIHIEVTELTVHIGISDRDIPRLAGIRVLPSLFDIESASFSVAPKVNFCV